MTNSKSYEKLEAKANCFTHYKGSFVCFLSKSVLYLVLLLFLLQVCTLKIAE